MNVRKEVQKEQAIVGEKISAIQKLEAEVLKREEALAL